MSLPKDEESVTGEGTVTITQTDADNAQKAVQAVSDLLYIIVHTQKQIDRAKNVEERNAIRAEAYNTIRSVVYQEPEWLAEIHTAMEEWMGEGKQ